MNWFFDGYCGFGYCVVSKLVASFQDLWMYDDLKRHLSILKKELKGYWIEKNSGYDEDICNILEMTPRKSRYWDAEWNDLFLEFKKGRSIWLDLVRYGEILLKVSPEASRETVTIFFIPHKVENAIEEILVVDTKRLIEKLCLTDEIAVRLVELKKHVPRQLNAQASLTLRDVRNISCWII